MEADLSFGDATISAQIYNKDTAIKTGNAARGHRRQRDDYLLPVAGPARRPVL